MTMLAFATDASKDGKLGFGGSFNREWFFGQWEPGYIDKYNPSIAYLELYALCAAVLVWAHKLRNGKFGIWCDNESAKNMVNSGVSKCGNCQYLLRMLALNNLMYNRKLVVHYVESAKNVLSDHLSRLRLNEFFRNAPEDVKSEAEQLPPEIWPASRIWQEL